MDALSHAVDAEKAAAEAADKECPPPLPCRLQRQGTSRALSSGKGTGTGTGSIRRRSSTCTSARRSSTVEESFGHDLLCARAAAIVAQQQANAPDPAESESLEALRRATRMAQAAVRLAKESRRLRREAEGRNRLPPLAPRAFAELRTRE